MRGRVEVYTICSDGTKEIIAEENNLLVDGAGESIVDMLTMPSSVLSYSSTIMDTSNWYFGAMTFGPASSFNKGPYRFPETYNSLIHQISVDKIVRVQQDDTGDVSAYTPPMELGPAPNPLNKFLVNTSTAYSEVSADGTESFGQFENRIAYASGDPSSYFQGSFMTGDTTTGFINVPQARVVSSYDGDYSSTPDINILILEPSAEGLTADNGVFGGFNKKKNMDYRGFAGIVYSYSSVVDAGGYAAYTETEPAGAGVPHHSVPVVYGITMEDGDLSGPNGMYVDARVVVEVKLYRWDCWAMNLYGGLHSLGLWSIDAKRAFLSNQPPLREGDDFIPASLTNFCDPDTGITKKEFKLFAKKLFTENLTQNTGHTTSPGWHNNKQLIIRWIIDFRINRA